MGEEIAGSFVAEPPRAGRLTLLSAMPGWSATERLAQNAEIAERAYEDKAVPQLPELFTQSQGTGSLLTLDEFS